MACPPFAVVSNPESRSTERVPRRERMFASREPVRAGETEKRERSLRSLGAAALPPGSAAVGRWECASRDGAGVLPWRPAAKSQARPVGRAPVPLAITPRDIRIASEEISARRPVSRPSIEALVSSLPFKSPPERGEIGRTRQALTRFPGRR